MERGKYRAERFRERLHGPEAAEETEPES